MRTLLNIIWIVFAGFWLFLGYVLAGVLLCIPIITIPWAIASFRIGIPMAIADFKMIPISLMPLGKDIVSTRQGAFDSTF
jgi:uncharacterized membrane protein YccF (DUF307 family)